MLYQSTHSNLVTLFRAKVCSKWANLQHERRDFGWEFEIGDLTESSCCPSRAIIPVQKERMNG